MITIGKKTKNIRPATIRIIVTLSIDRFFLLGGASHYEMERPSH
jgi:hypothetical protein